MALKLNGTNSVAAPAYAGDDADTGLQCGTNELKLVTGGTARATVDSSGRLLVGTTTEGYSVADNITIEDSADGGITIRTGTTNTGSIYFSDATSGGGEYDGYIEYSQNSRFMRFGTAQSERMRILSGGGITFNGDTATANALNDYEEGTWTPSVYSNDLTFDSATYVKVGRMVTAHCSLTGVGSYTAATSNPFYVFGFPFTTQSGGSNNTPTSATGSCRLTNMSASITTGTLSVCMDKNNTRCRIQKNATNAADNFISLADVGTGSFSVVINVTYYTT